MFLTLPLRTYNTFKMTIVLAVQPIFTKNFTRRACGERQRAGNSDLFESNLPFKECGLSALLRTAD